MDVSVLVPDSVPEGSARLDVRLHFANGVRIAPDSGILDLTLARSPVAAFVRSGGRLALFLALLLLVLAAALALVLMLRRMPRRAEAPIAAAVLQAEEESVARAASEATASGPVARSSAKGKTPQGAPAGDLLGGAAARARVDEGAAQASVEASGRVPEGAAQAAADGSPTAVPGAGKTRARPGRALPFQRKPDAHDAEVESSAASIAQDQKAEAERTVSILEQAAGRRRPAAKRSAADEAKLRAAAAAFSPRVVKPGSAQIELIVEDQNPHIGSRNVHTISAGGSKSVGGGASDFLVFLVSVPRKVAELHYDGEKLSFVPLRAELFPELSGPVEDCMGKAIPMISRAGYPLKLRFEAYEKPADKINRLLHCIETPGL